ncbi:MAG TPA: type II toxin-antitoxin system VapC family toxin [Gaiellaceae bacterium]
MTELLLDASVWVASADQDDPQHRAASILVERGADADISVSALDLTLYEVANTAVVKLKSPRDALELVRLVEVACGDGLLRVDLELLREASTLAVERALSIYDAAYVAVSQRRGASLVSIDSDLVGPGFAITPAQAVGA